MNYQMIIKCTVLVFTFASFSLAVPQKGSMTDSRDGKVYKTVKIGNQVWMAENLNYKTSRSHCAGDIDIGCNRFGRYYDWDEAMEACPEGWRLPTARDWESLFDAMGKSVYAMQGVTTFSLKSTDAYNFYVIPAGLYNFESDKVESAGGEFAGFWTATESADGSVFFWGVGPDRAGLQDGVPKRNAIYCIVCSLCKGLIKKHQNIFIKPTKVSYLA